MAVRVGAGLASGRHLLVSILREQGATRATTRTTWFAIARDGAWAVMTSAGGKTWAVPQGLEKLQHPQGDTGFYQHDGTLFVAGVAGANGDGVYRSTDRGTSWTRVEYQSCRSSASECAD